jgi:DNA-binding LytR/AlgR family response regulator
MSPARSHAFPSLGVIRRLRWTDLAVWGAGLGFVTLTQIGIALEDFQRSGGSGAVWEPVVWEVSSIASLTLLIPFVYWASRRFSISSLGLLRWIGAHAAATLPFAIMHIALMGGMREFAYAFTPYDYDTANLLLSEFFYEYKKDAVTYFVALGLVSALRKVGEGGEDRLEHGREPQRRLKLQSDQGLMIVEPARIEALEAAGNYVVVTTCEGSFETRSSLTTLVEECGDDVIQIHRRFAAGVGFIRRIEGKRSGDGIVTLTSGRQLRLSRRYKNGLAAALPDQFSGKAKATT